METKLIDPTLIKMPKMEEDDNIKSLRKSIRDKGILHPPIIKDNLEIVVGRKRVFCALLENIEAIEVKVVPSDLDEEEYKALSLHENLKRYNLPWYDQVNLEKELHELRQSQHGEGKRGKKVGWSLRDTADELEISFGGLSQDIRIADAVLDDPDLRKIGDKATALRVIATRTKLAVQQMGANINDKLVSEVHLGSSEKLLDMYDEGTFDACITDPPWIEFKDKSLTKDQFTNDVFRQIYRVLKHGAFLYAFVSMQDWFLYFNGLTDLGFDVQKWPLIWVKEGVLTHGSRCWEYQRNFEPIILAVKGSPALTDSIASSIFSFPVVNSNLLVHPNEKPIPLVKKIIEQCTFEGAIVLDPFAGSGSTALACKQVNRRYVMIERDKRHYMTILERIKEMK